MHDRFTRSRGFAAAFPSFPLFAVHSTIGTASNSASSVVHYSASRRPSQGHRVHDRGSAIQEFPIHSSKHCKISCASPRPAPLSAFTLRCMITVPAPRSPSSARSVSKTEREMCSVVNTTEHIPTHSHGECTMRRKSESESAKRREAESAKRNRQEHAHRPHRTRVHKHRERSAHGACRLPTWPGDGSRSSPFSHSTALRSEKRLVDCAPTRFGFPRQRSDLQRSVPKEDWPRAVGMRNVESGGKSSKRKRKCRSRAVMRSPPQAQTVFMCHARHIRCCRYERPRNGARERTSFLVPRG